MLFSGSRLGIGIVPSFESRRPPDIRLASMLLGQMSRAFVLPLSKGAVAFMRDLQQKRKKTHASSETNRVIWILWRQSLPLESKHIAALLVAWQTRFPCALCEIATCVLVWLRRMTHTGSSQDCVLGQRKKYWTSFVCSPPFLSFHESLLLPYEQSGRTQYSWLSLVRYVGVMQKADESHNGLRLASEAVGFALADLAGLRFIYAATVLVC